MNCRHVAWLAAQMHGNDNFRQSPVPAPPSPACAPSASGRCAAARVDVDEVHLRATIDAAVGGGDEADRRRPQPVPRSQSKRQAGDMQRRRCAVHRDRVTGAAVRRHRRFKPTNHRPLRQEVGPHDRHDGFDVSVGDIVMAVGNHASTLSCGERLDQSLQLLDRQEHGIAAAVVGEPRRHTPSAKRLAVIFNPVAVDRRQDCVIAAEIDGVQTVALA